MEDEKIINERKEADYQGAFDKILRQEGEAAESSMLSKEAREAEFFKEKIPVDNHREEEEHCRRR